VARELCSDLGVLTYHRRIKKGGTGQLFLEEGTRKRGRPLIENRKTPNLLLVEAGKRGDFSPLAGGREISPILPPLESVADSNSVSSPKSHPFTKEGEITKTIV